MLTHTPLLVFTSDHKSIRLCYVILLCFEKRIKPVRSVRPLLRHLSARFYMFNRSFTKALAKRPKVIKQHWIGRRLNRPSWCNEFFKKLDYFTILIKLGAIMKTLFNLIFNFYSPSLTLSESLKEGTTIHFSLSL